MSEKGPTLAERRMAMFGGGRAKSIALTPIDCNQSHHLPTDKQNGRYLQKLERIHKENRRDYCLFRQWVEKASGALNVFCQNSIPSMGNIESNAQGFLVEVDFDYNQKNFRPMKPAKIIDDDRSTSKRVDFQIERGNVFCGKIKYRDLELEIPIVLTVNGSDHEKYQVRQQPENALGESKGEWNEIFRNIRLEPPLFEKWARVERENRRKTYDYLMSNESFESFVVNAFHMSCSKHRCDPGSHVLVLMVTFGFGLGEIESIQEYFVLTRNRMLSNLREWYHLKSKTRHLIERQMSVLDAGETNSASINVPVLLLAHASRKIFVHHITVPSSRISQHLQYQFCKSNKVANDLFSQIQQRPPLVLTSPDLNHGWFTFPSTFEMATLQYPHRRPTSPRT